MPPTVITQLARIGVLLTLSTTALADSAQCLVDSARAQIGVTTRYDGAYVRLAFPGGDVPSDRGVCTDVVVRAFRGLGLDLQQAVHSDMRTNFARYPQRWGLRKADAHIDHRRVPNLQTWFDRQGSKLPTGSEFMPGDVVSWRLPGGAPHIGIVSDRRSADGTPLVLHNIARGVREEDMLHAFPITGHYRHTPQWDQSCRGFTATAVD